MIGNEIMFMISSRGRYEAINERAADTGSVCNKKIKIEH